MASDPLFYRQAILVSHEESRNRLQLSLLVESEHSFTLFWLRSRLTTVLQSEAAALQQLQSVHTHIVSLREHEICVQPEPSRRQAILLDQQRQFFMLVAHATQDKAFREYRDKRDAIYRKVCLFPPLVSLGKDYLRFHREFLNEKVAIDESRMRDRLKMQERLDILVAQRRTQRGDFCRAESRAREELEARDEHTAFCQLREQFLAEDAPFAEIRWRERRELLCQQEADARSTLIYDDEHTQFAQTILLSADSVNLHCAILEEVIAEQLLSELQLVVDFACASWDLLTIMAVESNERVFMQAEAVNTLQRTWDELQEQLFGVRILKATAQLQPFFRLHIARGRMMQRKLMATAQRNAECRAEAHTHRRELQERQLDALRTVTPACKAALAKIRVMQSAWPMQQRLLTAVGRGYLTRLHVADLADEYWSEQEFLLEERMTAAAYLLQRIGRAFLEREECCDWALERWAKIRAEQQQKDSAALVVQWFWKEHRLHLDFVRQRQEAARIEVLTRAAKLVQRVGRGLQSRQYFTLVLRPRRLVGAALHLQRVFRAALVRRRFDHSAKVLVIQRFVLAFVARTFLQGWCLYPAATQVQCFVRRNFARRLRKQRNAAHAARCDLEFKNGVVVRIQAAYRGYRYRKSEFQRRAEERAKRLAEVNSAATELLDDVWRVGRGYISRKRLGARVLSRLDAVCTVQSLLHFLAANVETRKRQQEVVASLEAQVAQQRCKRVQACLRSLYAKSFIVTQQQQDVKARFHQGTHLSNLVHRIVLGRIERTQLRGRFFERVWAVVRLQSFSRRMLALRHTAAAQCSVVAALIDREATHAAEQLTLGWRRRAHRRHLAAVTIQRNFLRRREKLQKRLELTEARRSLHLLERRRFVRREVSDRRVIAETDEVQYRAMIQKWFATEEVVLLQQQWRETQPRLQQLPPAFVEKEKKRRLNIEDATLTAYEDLFAREETERASLLARLEERNNTNAQRECALLSQEEAICRERLLRDQHNTRRMLRLLWQQRVVAAFQTQFEELEEEEDDARSALERQWHGETYGAVSRRMSHMQLHAIVATTVAPSADTKQSAAAAVGGNNNNENNSEQAAADSRRPSEAPVLVPSSGKPKRQLPSAHSRVVGALRTFQTPQDFYEPVDVTASDYQSIFGDALGARLPPLNDHIRQQQQQSAASTVMLSDEQRIEALSSRLVVSVDGVLAVKDLGDEATDDAVPAICDALRSAVGPITLLDISHTQLTSKGILSLLRFVARKKIPITTMDLSGNANVDDVVAAHVATMMEACDSSDALSHAILQGTSVSVGKRQLVRHLERRKSLVVRSSASAPSSLFATTTTPATRPVGRLQQFSKVRLGDVSASDDAKLAAATTEDAAATTPRAAALRRPRPLQIPRRNGWSVTYKLHHLAPLPAFTERAEKVANELSDAKE